MQKLFRYLPWLLYILALLFLLNCVRVAIPVGNSMEPTYKQGDLLLVMRCLGEPKTGDAVMVKFGDETWIKRVSAVAGESAGEVMVPEGYVYVVGDNLNVSKDSRDPSVGPIPITDVWGKVILKIKSGD